MFYLWVWYPDKFYYTQLQVVIEGEINMEGTLHTSSYRNETKFSWLCRKTIRSLQQSSHALIQNKKKKSFIERINISLFCWRESWKFVLLSNVGWFCVFRQCTWDLMTNSCNLNSLNIVKLMHSALRWRRFLSRNKTVNVPDDCMSSTVGI